ncbi:MAG: AAA family ATPase [Burkholderiales bacterium]
MRVRSDVERKRLHGLDATARTGAELDAGLYGAEATRRTYGRLAAAARAIVAGGFTAIVDAASLRRADRAAFRALARELGVPFVLATCAAPRSGAARAHRRAGAGRHRRLGRDIAVLERRRATQEPLDADERAEAVVFDTGAGPEAIAGATRALAERLTRVG